MSLSGCHCVHKNEVALPNRTSLRYTRPSETVQDLSRPPSARLIEMAMAHWIRGSSMSRSSWALADRLAEIRRVPLRRVVPALNACETGLELASKQRDKQWQL